MYQNIIARPGREALGKDMCTPVGREAEGSCVGGKRLKLKRRKREGGNWHMALALAPNEASTYMPCQQCPIVWSWVRI